MSSCDKEFTRRYSIERHRVIAHLDAITEELSSVILEEPPNGSDHDTEASNKNGSTDAQGSTDDDDSEDDADDDSSSDSQINTGDEDDNVWTSIGEVFWTPELDNIFDGKRLNRWRGHVSQWCPSSSL